MKPIGLHFAAEFINCSKNILNDKIALEQIVKLGINKSGFSLRELVSHQFTPVGVTVIAIIGESHIAIHTYPEAGHASLDIFACTSNHKLLTELLEFFKKKLKPKTARLIEIVRGDSLEIKKSVKSF